MNENNKVYHKSGFQFLRIGPLGLILSISVGIVRTGGAEPFPPMGVSNDTLTTVQVYPGDTDNSGSVDEFDILPLGLYWAYEGPSRDSVAVDWAPMSAGGWTPEEAAYADANGDGIVNEFDLFAIGFNWGKSHGSTPRPGANSFKVNYEDKERILLNINNLLYKTRELNNPALERLVLAVLARLEGFEEPSLSAPYPNPFNAAVRVGYRLGTETAVEFSVYDIRGRLVRTLINGRQPAGKHEVSWDGRDDRGLDLPSGVYFIRLKADSASFVRKVVLVR